MLANNARQEIRTGKARGAASAVLAVAVLGQLVATQGTAWARKNGIAALGCDGCHQGGQPPTVTLTASPMQPAAGDPVTLTITVSQTNGPVAGFYLTTAFGGGTFTAIDSGTAATSDGVMHTMPRTGSGGVTTFKAQWSSSKATGVEFDVYALSANGNNATSGDGAGAAQLPVLVGCGTGHTYYLDQDGDGYGTDDPAYPPRQDCAMPAGYAAMAGDCDDFHDQVHPGAPELCDGKDNDCNGAVDDSVVMQVYCEDKDGDGHGVTGHATKMDCAPSAGFGDCNGDCDDLSAAIYPGAAEVCNGYDDNCNGMVDEGVRPTCGTGWCQRTAATCTSTCVPGSPMVETCNAYDDDCDGVIDNGTDAELCGASGMACRNGQCVSASGGGTGGASGTGGVKGSEGTPGSGGASDAGVDATHDGTSASGGAGATSGTGSGGSRSGGSGGAAAGGSGSSGCALVGPAGPSSATLLWLTAVVLGPWLARRRRWHRRCRPDRIGFPCVRLARWPGPTAPTARRSPTWRRRRRSVRRRRPAASACHCSCRRPRG